VPLNAVVIGVDGRHGTVCHTECFAAYNGTAPIEVSSGEKKIYRLSRRGNRRLNHAIHMAAITSSTTMGVRHRADTPAMTGGM
jgi:hypothetical protein